MYPRNCTTLNLVHACLPTLFASPFGGLAIFFAVRTRLSNPSGTYLQVRASCIEEFFSYLLECYPLRKYCMLCKLSGCRVHFFVHHDKTAFFQVEAETLCTHESLLLLRNAFAINVYLLRTSPENNKFMTLNLLNNRAMVASPLPACSAVYKRAPRSTPSSQATHSAISVYIGSLLQVHACT